MKMNSVIVRKYNLIQQEFERIFLSGKRGIFTAVKQNNYQAVKFQKVPNLELRQKRRRKHMPSLPVPIQASIRATET